MRWIYLSPHFDDVVLSCGGLVHEQVLTGQKVEIWTACAGEPPKGAQFSAFAQQLHERWGTGVESVTARKMEDQAAGHLLGAHLRYWDLPDCIYRQEAPGTWLVNGEEDLWKPLPAQQHDELIRLGAWIAASIQPEDQLVCPITLGNHLDHQLVRQTVENLQYPFVWYYPDYPYAVRVSGQEDKFDPDWKKVCYTISEPALAAWQDAIACHTSQISTFWGSLIEMQSAIRAYWNAGGGTCLYQKRKG